MRRPEDEVLLQLSSPGLLQKSDMAIDDGKEVIIFRLIHELLDLIVPGSLVLVVAGDPKPAHITGAGPISIAFNKSLGMAHVSIQNGSGFAPLILIQSFTFQIQHFAPG